MKVKVVKGLALIVVDLQNDFCPGGTLPVPKGDKVIPIINKYIAKFSELDLPIFATRDWHPIDHCSFKPKGVWPPHCVQGSKGAEFHPNLLLPKEAMILSKATTSDEEAYSGFQGTELRNLLEARGIDTLLVGGLATDYCVKSTVLDGLKEGFKVYYLKDAARGVNMKRGDSKSAEKEMREKGAMVLRYQDVERKKE